MNITRLLTMLRKYRRYVLLAIVDVVFFGFMSPDASSFVIIPAFLLLVLTIYVVLMLIVAYFGKMFVVKPSNQKRIVFMLTASAAIVIALQSIGQLTIRDVVTIVPLILVLYVYVSYTKSRRV